MGIFKGKGFVGIMKWYGFCGQGVSYGVQVVYCCLGFIGGCVMLVWVFKGIWMVGWMGNDWVIVFNFLVYKVDVENGVLLIKGVVFGCIGGLVMVCSVIK